MAKRQKAKSIKTLIKNYGIMWRRDSVFWDFPGGQTKKKTPQKRGRYSCSALYMDNPWGGSGGGGRGGLQIALTHDQAPRDRVHDLYALALGSPHSEKMS